jgi:hypothetical protein
MVAGSQALDSTITTMRKRPAGFQAQQKPAASTEFPPEQVSDEQYQASNPGA